MNKLFKVLSLGLTASIALSSVPAYAAGAGETARAAAKMTKTGVNTFVRGVTSTAVGISGVCATGYENAHVLRVIAISGLAGIGAYACFTKLDESFDKEGNPKGFVKSVKALFESGTRRLATATVLLASGLAFDFIRRGFNAELDACDAAAYTAWAILEQNH